jgi:hypothetical protein
VFFVFLFIVFCFFILFYFAFAPCHHLCYCLLCYVVPCLTLQLFSMVHHSLLCIHVVWCGVSPSPYTLAICCSVSTFALHCYCLLWCIACALRYHYCLLWFVILCFALLFLWFFTLRFTLMLLVVVHCPSPCVVIIRYGVSSFILHYCLLWFVTLALHCYYFLLWYVIPHLALLLLVVVSHLCLMLLLIIVVCHSLPCIVLLSLQALSRYSLHYVVACCGLSLLTLCYY